MVTAEQMQYLLHIITTATRRKFTAEEGSLWLHLLSDHSYDELHEAVMDHLKEPDDYLQPGTIKTLVRRRRASRIKAAGDPKLPSGLSGDEYNARLAAWHDHVSKPPKAPSPPPSLRLGQSAPSAPQLGR